MINFQIPKYQAWLHTVHLELSRVQAVIQASGDAALDGAEKDTLRLTFTDLWGRVQPFGLRGAEVRIKRIGEATTGWGTLTRAEVVRHLLSLIEAFEDDTKTLYLFAYPQGKVALYLQHKKQWAPTIAAFQSTEKSVGAASDLYALGYNDACVFHLMQILERGLSALAKDVHETFDTQQWETIIGTIEGKIKGMQHNGIPQLSKLEKDARLQFLSEAAKEFRYFKDGWRNYVSHGRGGYDEDQTKSVYEHVRVFMNHLSSQLSETATVSSVGGPVAMSGLTIERLDA